MASDMLQTYEGYDIVEVERGLEIATRDAHKAVHALRELIDAAHEWGYDKDPTVQYARRVVREIEHG